MSARSSSPVAMMAPHGIGVRETDPSSVGMMEGAFFVGRTELLDWINSTLQLQLTRVEQCASGCVYIQALDAMLGPKSRVAMNKVKWGAKHEYEYVSNYKILQAAFDAHGIQKHIEVSKLVRAKYQDNLEFLQWLKAFCDRQAPLYATDIPYDAVERRKLGIGPYPEWAPVGGDGAAARDTRKPAASASSNSRNTSATPAGRAACSRPKNTHLVTSAHSSSAAAADTKAAHHKLRENHSSARPQRQAQQPVAAAAATAGAARDVATESLQADFEQAILERDFYYQKLRRIEVLCCAAKAESLPVTQLQAILYAKDEDIGDHDASMVQ